MEEPSDIAGKPSRRAFAKSVAAAFVATPLVASCGADPEPPSDSNTPPVIITNGSLYVETVAPLKQASGKPRHPKHKMKYELEGESGRNIGCVTIKKNGAIVWCGSFSDLEKCEIAVYFADCATAGAGCTTPTPTATATQTSTPASTSSPTSSPAATPSKAP